MLKPYWKTLEQKKEENDIIYRRTLKLRARIEKHGGGIEGKYLSSCCDSLSMLTLYVYPDEKTEKIKHDIVRFLLALAPGEKPVRTFNNKTGNFSWKVSYPEKDEIGAYQVLIDVSDVFEGACTVKKVTETVTMFEADCSPAKEKEPC